MKKKSILLTSICFLVLAFSSCQKEYLVNVSGKLSGYITDNNKNPLSKAYITIDNSLKDSTDANGYYSYSGLSVGQHSVIFSKKGYATIKNTITVEPSYETTKGKESSTEIAYTSDASLTTLNGMARGTATLQGLPVAGGKVIAYYSSNYNDNNSYYYNNNNSSIIYPIADTTTTDANGAFSFSKLPIGVSVSFVAYNSTGTASGSLSTRFTETAKYTQTNLGNIPISETPLSLLSYTGQGSDNGSTDAQVDTTNSIITLTFSENVSESLTKLKEGWVKLYSKGTQIGASVAYSGKTITITPASKFAANQMYYFDYAVAASDTKFAKGTYYFITKPKVTSFAAPTITINVTSTSKLLQLTTPTNGAVSYKIFYKVPNSADFIYVPYMNLYNGSTYNLSSYTTGTQFYVVPLNRDNFEGPASNIVTL